MIENGKVLVTSDVLEEHFVCDLLKCKGACCVEGDLGAPLEEEELDTLDENYQKIKKYMAPEGIAVVEKYGSYIKDWEGDYSTTTVDGKDCVFVYYDEQKIAKCAIEKAYREGEIDFYKPISCHLYPIRISKLKTHEALNYDRWDICSPACDNGDALKVKVYQFLKQPIIRKYGQDWYDQLEKLIEEEG